MLGSTLGPANVITLGLDEESEPGSSYGSVDGSNKGKPDSSWLGA